MGEGARVDALERARDQGNLKTRCGMEWCIIGESGGSINF